MSTERTSSDYESPLASLRPYECSRLADDLEPFCASSMVPGYCRAGSRKDEKAMGGYGTSDNAPKKLGDLPHGSAGEVSLVALPSEQVPLAREYRGFRLLLINRTKAEMAFVASDSFLSILCEALDEHHQWRRIEYMRESECGNSFHHVFLPTGYYWEFTAPTYAGKMTTKLRFKLVGKPPIYSNEFEGSINPYQFISPERPR